MVHAKLCVDFCTRFLYIPRLLEYPVTREKLRANFF